MLLFFYKKTMIVKRDVKTDRLSTTWQGRDISFEMWKLAVQADASIRMQFLFYSNGKKS